MLFKTSYKLLFLILFIVFSLPSGYAKAAITILDNFEFGLITILNNTAQRTYRVRVDNTTNYDTNHFAVFTSPNRGRIRLTGAPASTPVSVNSTPSPILYNGIGPEFFTISINQTSPASPLTDGTGMVTILFDSTLSTSGDGTTYPQGSYEGTLEVTLTY